MANDSQPPSDPALASVSGSDDESRQWKIPDRIYNSALALAMLALQSARYGNDPDYRQAVDDVLGWATPWSRQNDRTERPADSNR